jgi:hypothetical protein
VRSRLPGGSGVFAASEGEAVQTFPTVRDVIGRVGVGLAVLLGLLGLAITFVPGAQAGWFGVAAGSAAVGLLSPAVRVRGLAAVLVLGLAWLAWDRHLERLRYREWLEQRDREPKPTVPDPL